MVTRGDGRLALGRLGALCEQVCYSIELENDFCFFFIFNSIGVKMGSFPGLLKIKIILKQSHNNCSFCGC